MTVALRAGYDLGVLAGIFVAIALISLVSYTFARLAQVLDFSVFGIRPLHNLAQGIESVIVDGCNDAVKWLEKQASSFLSGLIDSLGFLIGLAALLYLGVRAGLEFLWSHALHPLIEAAVSVVRTVAHEAKVAATDAYNYAAHEVARLDATITSTAEAVLGSSNQFTRDAVADAEAIAARGLNDLAGNLEEELRRLAQGIDSTGTAVETLRRAEEQALQAAREAIGATAADLRDLERQLPLGELAGAVAAVPIVTAMVRVLEAETGLDNAACREKVKGICGTDPARWAQLLGSIALVGAWPGLEQVLRDIAQAAETALPLVRELVRPGG